MNLIYSAVVKPARPAGRPRCGRRSRPTSRPDDVARFVEHQDVQLRVVGLQHLTYPAPAIFLESAPISAIERKDSQTNRVSRLS
jgi:hypothetical protein